MSESPFETQQVWDEFGCAVRGFIRRRVHHDDVADDLLQDVFVRIHEKLHRLNDRDRLAAWLYQIARNVIVDHYRRAKTLDDPAVQGIEAEVGDAPANLNRQVVTWLTSLVQHLPQPYREAVALAELHGVAQKEIAQRIGLSLSAAKSRVQRGRAMLKDMLLQCCHFELDRVGNVVDYTVNQGCSKCCGPENEQSGPR